MRRAFACVALAALVALPFGASADEPPNAQPVPEHAALTSHTDSNAPMQPATAAPRAHVEPKTVVSPIAITAKRTHPRLELKLTSQSMDRVLDESGVEPVAESEAAADTIEVTGRRVEQEPIMMGIPALFYGITHPTEAWRIFAPIQP